MVAPPVLRASVVGEITRAWSVLLAWRDVLALGGLGFDGIDGDWRLDLAIDSGRVPTVDGDVRFTARQMSLGSLSIDEVEVRAEGTSTAAQYQLQATSGEARSLEHNGRVSWGDLPRLRVDADRLRVHWD